MLVGLGGCVDVDVPEKIDVNVNGGGSSNGGSSGGSDSQGEGGWKETAQRVAGRIFTDTQEGNYFFGYDVLTLPDQTVQLVAQVTTTYEQQDLENMTVVFRRKKGDEKLGSVKTDADGRAEMDWKPPGEGVYHLAADIIATPNPETLGLIETPEADLSVYVRPRDTRFVVVDMDRTLVGSNFARVLILDGGKPMPGSQDVMKRIRRRYEVIYLTHRPRDLTRKSRNWLIDHDYPAGPLLLSTRSEAFGDAAAFKGRAITEIHRDFPNIRYGLGDKLTDVEAYLANKVTAIWIPHYDPDDADELRDKADEIEDVDEDVIVVENWRQIEEAIFGSYRRSPEEFADDLRDRARRIDRDDDDDDDDDGDDD
jgi:hypothetical protein